METEVAIVREEKPAQAVMAQDVIPPDHRDGLGRFKPGWSGNRKGNTLQRKQAALRRALMSAVSPDDVRSLTHAMLKAAKGGDVAAARLLAEYCLGKPRPLDEDDEQAGPMYKVYIGIDEARI